MSLSQSCVIQPMYVDCLLYCPGRHPVSGCRWNCLNKLWSSQIVYITLKNIRVAKPRLYIKPVSIVTQNHNSSSSGSRIGQGLDSITPTVHELLRQISKNTFNFNFDFVNSQSHDNLHMRWQLYCRCMCKIDTCSYHYLSYNHQYLSHNIIIYFYKSE